MNFILFADPSSKQYQWYTFQLIYSLLLHAFTFTYIPNNSFFTFTINSLNINCKESIQRNNCSVFYHNVL